MARRRAEPERLRVLPSDESKLIGEAQRGDPDAFEELVRRYDQRVLRLVLRIVRSEDDARDLYQEAFLKIFRSLKRFRHECRFETWLFRVVTNACLDRLRRAAARPEERPASVVSGVGEATDLDQIAEDRPEYDPERALARQQLSRRIDSALDRLGPRERFVFEMRHYEGLRLRDIGDLLETSEATVKNCLFRAHRHMRRALQDLGGVSDAAIHERPDTARAEV